MTDRELLQQALDALKHLCLHSAAIKGYDGEQVQTAIDALKARLAQPWCMAMNKCENKCEDCPDKPNNEFNPDWDAIAVMVEEQQRMAKRIEELTQLVTIQGIRLMDAETQLEKEWVGLTKEELAEISEFYFHGAFFGREVYEDIETRLKGKNGG